MTESNHKFHQLQDHFEDESAADRNGMTAHMAKRPIRFSLVASTITFVVIGGCGRSGENTERPSVESEQVVAAGQEKNSTVSQTSQIKSIEAEGSADSKNGRLESQGEATGQEADAASKVWSSVGYRLAKLRTAPADSVLASNGLRKIESKRLVLITDSDNPELGQLPVLADQLFDALQTWFGELPPAADGSEFQVLGFVMVDRAKFRAADLLPNESFTIRHGRHLRYTFWCGYPDTSYYRRHLALHEFVHCFMTCESEQMGVPSPWYLEGMAELFGTHSIGGAGTDAGAVGNGAVGGVVVGGDGVIGLTEADYRTDDYRADFAVMPSTADGFEGWGRIRAFRESFAVGDHQQLDRLQIPPFDQVVPDQIAVFATPFDYSSSWAVCWFLKNHPQTQNVMPTLAKQRTYAGFVTEWQRQKNEFGNRWAVDWLLFAEQLDFGFDAMRCFPVHTSSIAFNGDNLQPPATLQLDCSKGWQDTGIRLAKGQTISVKCSGSCVVNHTTLPWQSSPDGISIDYYRGHKLGQVLAVIVSEDGQQITDRIAIGSRAELKAQIDGRMWLQVNDDCGGRANNTGSYQVQLGPSK